MKALSIRQPWASLIMIGAKRIETRSRPTHFRGRVAIHSSLRMGPAERHAARCAVPLPWLRAVGLDEGALPCGVVLGTVEIIDSLQAEDLLRWLDSRRTPDAVRERLLGDYSPGRWGWILRDPQPLIRAVPARGALSFWEWTP